MFRLVTRGRLTHDYLKGFISAPEDREPAVRKLIEKAGGKVLNFYFTTGETDFLLVTETEEAENIIAALMAAAATGAVSHVTNVRAWTGAEFKSVAEKASKAASAYRPPGKKRWLHALLLSVIGAVDHDKAGRRWVLRGTRAAGSGGLASPRYGARKWTI